MFLKQIFMAICAFSFGSLCSAGVFTVLASVGLIPRFSGKFHVAKHVLLLEEMVIYGTIVGGVVSVFWRKVQFGDAILKNQIFGQYTAQIWNLSGKVLCVVFGIFAGMFVGCLALAIAEMLDSIPIFTRRVSFRKGIGIVVLLVALGKLCGSLLYFSQAFFAL